MKIKKLICILTAIVMISLLAACAGENGGGGSGPVDSDLSGSAIDVLSKLDADLAQTGIEMPMTLPPTEVTADMSQNDIGLSSSDFNRLVVDAASSLAAIGTFAHQIAVIQANDASAAAEVKRLISGTNGYDALKWICVWPERVIVVESGAYVLLAAANADVVDAAIEAFRSEAGAIGTVVTFFEHDGGLEPPEGALPIELG